MNRCISICHANVRSIKDKEKFTQVKCELEDQFDIITLSETWLSNKESSIDYRIYGYQAPFRRDRSVGVIGYGGIIAFVSNSIACKRRLDLESHDIEGMWLEIRVVNDKFFLFVLYRAESNTDGNYWQLLQDNIDYI